MDELRRREVTRTANNPVSDYTESLVAAALGLDLGAPSASGHDATDQRRRKYQIKGRRLTAGRPSAELGAIRRLEERPFDFLVAVIYNPDFTVAYAANIPYGVVRRVAKYSAHTNAHRFVMRRSVLDLKGVVDVTRKLLSVGDRRRRPRG